MIVDDHRMFAEGLGRLLAEESDIELLGIACTSTEALDLAARLKPQVMLIDYLMPGQDGLAVGAEVGRVSPTTATIMITGAAEDRIVLSAIEVGYSGFITKDRAAAEVVDAVRAAAVGEAVISSTLLKRLLPRLNRTRHILGDDLTDREREVLGALVEGLTNRDIALKLSLSVNTIRNYIQSILLKLNAHSKLQAVTTAVKAGIVEYPSH